MIGTVCVEIQGKFPAMPLDPMQAFVGSPSSIRVRNVPKKIGDWQITSVKFVVVYPDASIKNTTCRLVGGVWVGTVEGTLTSGTSKNGYSIFADGIDENGNDVVGYCLGKGDVEILKADGTIDPDAPAFYVKLLEEQSEDPKPGEMWFNGDEMNIVDANGDVQTFEQPDLSDYAKKGDPVSEFRNDAGYLNMNTVNSTGIVQKMWNGNANTATQYINGNCEVWGHYNRTEWEYSDGIYREPHVRYDEEGFGDYGHWLVYVDVSDFTPMPNCWYETEADALNSTEFSFAYGQEQEYVDAFKVQHEGWEKTGDLVTDNTKLFNAAGNQYVTGDCEVFKQETVFSPWSFSDGLTRSVVVEYTEDSPYEGRNWVICGSDCSTLPYSDCFYSTKEAAETTLSFAYPFESSPGEWVDVVATRTSSMEWVLNASLATMNYVDQQIGLVLSEAF